MRFLGFVVLTTAFLQAAEKPSPFTARTSGPPAVAPVAPVSPVVPASLLRAARPRPFVTTGLPSAVSPANRPAPRTEPAPAPPPPAVATIPQLKTAVIMVPEIETSKVNPPQVGDIEMGSTRDQVVSRLGSPATAISMYENSQFLESLRYEWKGKWLGTVRMVNGKVATIDHP